MKRRKLTAQEIQGRAELLKRRHRSEWCQLVFESCVDRSMQEVADILGYTRQWVADHLKRFAIESSASGGVTAVTPLTVDGGKAKLQIKDTIQEIVKVYSPKEPKESYVEEYEIDGYKPEVAKCLATAYEAGENALDAGIIRENKQGRKEIVLPDKSEWEMRLRRAMADVKCAAGLLDGAKINDLKRASTRKQVAAADAKWQEQMELLENYHPGFRDEIYKAAK